MVYESAIKFSLIQFLDFLLFGKHSVMVIFKVWVPED